MKNWELGFRVRGFTYNIDWTLLWYNAPFDGPVVNATHGKAFTAQYMGVAVPAMLTGKRSFTWDDLPDVTSYPHDVYYWKRVQTFGGTAQTTFNNFMPSAVWRCEVAFNKNEPFNLSTDQTKTNIYDWTRKKTLAVAFSWSDRWNIPWFTRALCTGKQLETTLTYYRQTILDYDGNLVTQDSYIDRGDTANEAINLFVQAYLFNYSWVFTFVGQYQTYSDRYQAVPVISYVFPGEHWRADFGAKWYNAKRGYVRSTYWAHDSLIFRLRYEF